MLTPMARTPRPLTLALRLASGGSSLRERLSEALLEEMREGRLHPGDPLPASRALAAHLGVGRQAVVAAYDELVAAGYVDSVPGAGTYVAPGADRAALAGASCHVDAPAPRERRRASPAGSRVLRWNLRPGRPDTSLIATADWRRAWRHAATLPIDDDSSVRTSHPELQASLSAHLRRTRGVVAEPHEILVVPGVSVVMRALGAAAALTGRGVAVEDPGYTEAPRTLADAGARVRGVPVDGDGLDPALLRPGDHAAYVTPAHQYPLGARMPAQRRADLVRWGARTGGLLIEDDYDGEFRYGVSPLPSLRSLQGARDHVAYIGTASKILTPAIRLAWIVPPPQLLEPLATELEEQRLGVDRMAGLAVSHLVDSGALARHLARASRHYGARRAALVDALHQRTPGLPLLGVDAGLHLVVALPDDVDDMALAFALEDRGVGVEPLSAYAINDTRRGLVIGYAGLPETQAATVVAAMAPLLP